MSEHSLLLETPPRSWTAGSFGDVCIRVQDATSPTLNGQRLYLGLENLASGFPALVGRGSESEVRSGKTSFRKGDVLFGKLRPYLRKSTLVSEDGICSTDILVFRSSKKSLPEFLCLLTHSDEFVEHAIATTSGVQHPRTSWASLREFKLHFPPLSEQRKIAGVLGVVQRAIELQEQLIALTTELKKALLHQLFTQGLRGESQKQTEIGPVPESWEVVPLGSLVVDAPQVNMRSEAERIIQYIDVSSISRDHLRIRSTESFVLKEAPGRARKKVRAGDVIFATVRPTLLRLVRIAGEYDGQVCSTAFCVLRDKNERTSGRFIYYLLQREQFLKQLAAIESGASYPAVKDGQVKEQLVPVPQEAEQVDIAANLEACDAKIDLHRRKHIALTALFRTLLHQLMTAQIRVHDLDLDGILSQVVRENGDKQSPGLQSPLDK